MEHDKTDTETVPEETGQPVRRPRRVAWLSVAVAVVCVCVAALFPVFERLSERSRIKASEQNLKQLGLAFKVYAARDPENLWPPLSTKLGQLALEANTMYPEHISDAEVFISPAHPDARLLRRRAKEDPLSVITDHSYWYLGYAIPDEETGMAFLDHYRERAGANVRPVSDIELGSRTVFRLRGGVVQFRIEGQFPNERMMRYIGGRPAPLSRAPAIIEHDRLAVLASLFDFRVAHASSFGIPQSTIPVMIERPGLHNEGANVLFYDGHVSFIQYPGPFPMTQKSIGALEALDDLKVD